MLHTRHNILLVLILSVVLWGQHQVAFSQGQPASHGSIIGTVEIQSVARSVKTGGYGNPYQRRGANHTKSADSEPTEILVWLTSDQDIKPELRSEPIILNQQDQAFDPQLLPVLPGETVRILNSDPVYHNVFSLSKVKRFDVGRRPKGNYKDVIFDETGIVDVFCDIHSNMHALVVVMPMNTRDWQILADRRSFTFEDLPAGTYQLNVVAKGFDPIKREITVESGLAKEVTTLQLSR